MALSDEQIEGIFIDHGWHFGGAADAYIPAARAIEAEVRKQDTELIRQMLEAMEAQCAMQGQTRHRLIGPAIAAAKQRLGDV